MTRKATKKHKERGRIFRPLSFVCGQAMLKATGSAGIFTFYDTPSARRQPFSGKRQRGLFQKLLRERRKSSSLFGFVAGKGRKSKQTIFTQADEIVIMKI
ncbi:MAG: hypothetical protein IKM08_07075 [Clostridia bacterium]|nr:hypothetical protein [Clostridia bacterium]